jgi:hypothetical protein
MSNNDSLNDIKKIKDMMSKTNIKISKNAGWFFIVWGIIWFIGFMFSQFLPSISYIIWIILNVVGISVSIFLINLFYGRKSNHFFSGIGKKVFLVTFGIILFDVLMALSFKLYDVKEITLLIAFSTGVCYFIVGVFTLLRISIFGFILSITIFLTNLFFSSFLYLLTAIFCGGLFIISGIALLKQKEK